MYWMLHVWALTTGLAAALTQYNTNGRSKWGTLPSPTLPRFLGDTHGVNPPWGNTYPGGNPPDTGVTRHYNFTITRGFKAPDGYNKSVILINNQFPGPLIEANWGDMIEVTVTNDISTVEEGLTLHWHGLSMKKTPWYNGVPGYTQCPIAPGKTFTYIFQADQFGSSWYHSHYSAQYDDGLYGPMVIYGPVQAEVNYDYDLGPIMLSDYYHDNYYDVLVEGFKRPTVLVPMDNNLINGKGTFDCDSTLTNKCLPGAGLSKFQVKSGKSYRLRLVNTGALASQKFSIDNHKLTVIANDFVPVKPYLTDVVTLGVGQRTDVIVEATGSTSDSVWMQSDIDIICLNETLTVYNISAAVYYESTNTSALPTTRGTPWKSNHCQNDPLKTTVPYYPLAPPSRPETVQTVNIILGYNETVFLLFFVDGSSFRSNYNEPVLLMTHENMSQVYPAEHNIYNFSSNLSVRIILVNTFAMQHPIHLHGHNFWVLAEGMETWNGSITNPSNPQRRDTQIIQAGTVDDPGYLVLEWEQNNPGVWPMHCHMSNHACAGLVLSILFSDANYVDEIDSGI
ncbi:laccase precursor [Aspergillus neoniger CBS 115656]|uniref:Laccase n=1 Tax=Aspergillus neoniger (strain CBS 115656) TaxID=1448310 RepID=A0A318Y6L7_ASPNB|nr:laccase precursor [Aspergillus neoniger CBS 115656]PYH29861.1 laccase precursor [Aspergillus neoniger CBS 115656]